MFHGLDCDLAVTEKIPSYFPYKYTLCYNLILGY